MMAVATLTKPEVRRAFPAAKIEDRIRNVLDREAAVQTTLRGGTTTRNSPIIGPQPVIDSLVAVQVLIEIESVLSFTLPEIPFRAGGYNSTDEMVADLLPRLEQQWCEHQKESSRCQKLEPNLWSR